MAKCRCLNKQGNTVYHDADCEIFLEVQEVRRADEMKMREAPGLLLTENDRASE